MSPISDYFRLRASGLSMKNSARCAGIDVSEMISNLVVFLSFVAIVLYLISDIANAVEPDQHKLISEQHQYISALERTLSKCLGDKEQAIKIGDEWFLCGATSIGKY